MAEQNQAQAAAQAPAKVADAVAATAEKLANESAKSSKRARAATARRAKREESAKPVARKTRTAKPRRSTRTAARKAASATNQRTENVNFNSNELFAGFTGTPAFAPFQSLFANAGDRGEQAVRRSQQFAEGFADLTRGNVEAIVEAGRVAAEGARSIGQDVVASSRDSVEQAADAIRTLAEAKSPTEFVQLQSEIARNSFDRLVSQSSRLTETMVKLAGEAIQPLSNRASANAERINSFVA
jgi:phasin family protein